MTTPEAKKTKTGEEGEETVPGVDPALQPFVDEVLACQEQLGRIDEEEDDAIRKVQEAMDAKRKPVFGQRAAAIAKIPGFWSRCLDNHDLCEYLTEADRKAMDYLVDISFEDGADSLKFIFRFKENPYFANDELVKEFRMSEEDGTLEAVPFKIRWKQDIITKSGGDASSAGTKESSKRPRESQSFFLWFDGTTPFDDNDVVELLKELCIDPLRFFLGQVDEDDDDDDGEGGDFDDEVDDEDEVSKH